MKKNIVRDKPNTAKISKINLGIETKIAWKKPTSSNFFWLNNIFFEKKFSKDLTFINLISWNVSISFFINLLE